MTPPNVFVSYSHDSDEHKQWVLKLASDLRVHGIDATLDQWDLVPGQDLPGFMYKGIARADRVVMVCSEKYVAKSEAGSGGVGYERLIVTAEVTESIDTKKFIPVVRGNTTSNKIPKHLGSRLYIDFSDDDSYKQRLEELCREILGVPATPKPPLGQSPFSGLIPAVGNELRSINSTGVLPNGQSVLSGSWFELERELAQNGIQRCQIGAAMELRLSLHSPVNKSQVDLLAAVRNAEITTFGWPIAVVIEQNEEHRPKPYHQGIRAEVAINGDRSRKSYDYWSVNKSGDFYLIQSLFEDTREEWFIFFNTRIVRVTESLLFAERMYANLGVPSGTKLSVRVTHDGLAGRILASATNRRIVMGQRKSFENKSETEIVITLGNVHETLVSDVKRLVAPLFMLFEFTEFNDEVYEDIVRKFELGEST